MIPIEVLAVALAEVANSPGCAQSRLEISQLAETSVSAVSTMLLAVAAWMARTAEIANVRTTRFVTVPTKTPERFDWSFKQTSGELRITFVRYGEGGRPELRFYPDTPCSAFDDQGYPLEGWAFEFEETARRVLTETAHHKELEPFKRAIEQIEAGMARIVATRPV